MGFQFDGCEMRYVGEKFRPLISFADQSEVDVFMKTVREGFSDGCEKNIQFSKYHFSFRSHNGLFWIFSFANDGIEIPFLVPISEIEELLE